MKKLFFFLLSLCVVLPFSLFSQIPDHPCFLTDIMGSPNDYLALDRIDYDCDDFFGTIISFPTDEHVMPVCPREKYGSLQLSFGFHDATQSSPVDFEICLEVNQVFFMTDHTFDNTPSQTGDWLCTTMTVDGPTCGSFFIKPVFHDGSMSPLLFNNLRTKVTKLDNQEICYDDDINVGQYYIEGAVLGNFDGIENIQGNGSLVYYSDILASYPQGSSEPLEANMYVSEFTTLVLDETYWQNYNFGFNEFSFILGEGAQIVIPDGVFFDCIECKFFGCTNPWESLLVEEGATVNIQESFKNESEIRQAETGVEIESGTWVYIVDTEIHDCETGLSFLHNNLSQGNYSVGRNHFWDCDIGISVDGSLSPFLPALNHFDNLPVGIKVENTIRGVVNISPIPASANTFDNCIVGIEVFNGAANIQNNDFIENTIGVKVGQSTSMTTVKGNDIGFTVSGVQSSGGLIDANGNDVGINNGSGIHAFSLFGNIHGSMLVDNTIDADRHGILTGLCSNLNIEDNTIDVGNSTENSRGIHLFGSDAESVYNNTINTTYSRAGIACVSGVNTSHFENNTVTGSQNAGTDGFQVLGSVNQELVENVSDGTLTYGTRIANSGNTLIECNDLTANDRALYVDAMSDMHNILTNDFRSNIDVLTRSSLGIQEHNGNLFWGEDSNDVTDSYAEAIGLTEGELALSRFIYDEYDFNSNTAPIKPYTWDPNGLFLDQVTGQIGTATCNNQQGAYGNSYVDNNVCNYLNSIDSLKLSQPNEYYTNLYHVYLSMLTQVDTTQWPQCLKSIWTSDNTCFKELAVSQYNIYSSIQNNDSTYLQLITDYITHRDQERYDSITTELIEDIELKVSQHSQQFQQNLTQELNHLSSIISCNSTLGQLWLDTYNPMLIHLNGTILDTITLNELRSTAMLCPSYYGDAVNWSRSVLSGYENIRYNLNDEACHSQAASRKQDVELTFEIKIAPNPSNSRISISIPLLEDAEISLMDLNGRLLKTINASGLSTIDMDVSRYASGFYLVNLQGEKGLLATSKLIIQK